jgi:acyl-CoA synthetase (AMP-forming)/AMP-acid ligase II
MSNSETKPAEKPSADFTRTWRYKLGLFMIIAGNGVIVISLFLPIFGISAGIVGALVIGGEIVSMGSIAFLGKEGFKAIKSKFFGVVKTGYTASVSRTRHYIGIVLLCTNVLTTYIMIVYAWISFSRTTAETPMPEVLGLSLAEQGSLVFWLFLIGELSFLVAIYVLGADWWGRFRRIFVWEGQES